jgi:hypothetical protein
VAAERRLHILGLFRDGGGANVTTKRLCEVCAEATATSGAGIMLMDGDVSRGSICTTDGVSELIEQLQYELGEGPCIDAHVLGTAVMEPDLAEPARVRWMAFTGPAIAAGARAVFGFPLQVGAARLGAMNLYNTHPGSLTDDQHGNALVVADIAAQTVLLLQANASPDTVADELAAGADFHYLVHQAAGMVAAQLDVPVGQALIRLRSHAFGNQRTLTDVATDIVNRTLRLRPEDPGPAPTERDSQQ